MDLKPKELHVVLFPLMCPGHMIPILDTAKLFAAQGVKTTIISTPSYAPVFLKPLQKSKNVGPPITIEIISFPSEEVGLPKGVEGLEDLVSPEMAEKFFMATQMLQKPLENVLEKYKPHCLVADFLFPFANQAASKFNIPRLVFYAISLFSMSCLRSVIKYEPYKMAAMDDEDFVIPHLPHHVKLTRMQISSNIRDRTASGELLVRSIEAEEESYGVIFNSFYDLESDYADYYRRVLGRKTWVIGPVSLCNQANEAKFQRGKEASIDEHECLRWLDSKKPNSVIYVCFGTLSLFSDSQLSEIAMGLEASGLDFIWVVKRGKGNEEWVPNGFEDRVLGKGKGKGLVIRGWAPQLLILDHWAVGGFLTHCGWNSIMEGVSCGVPMATWPVFSEQFYNEKLVTEVLKIGVGVGVKEWSINVEDRVKWEGVKEALERLLVGKEAMEMRNRAKKLKEKARKGVKEGGSSYSDLTSLIQELISSVKESCL